MSTISETNGTAEMLLGKVRCAVLSLLFSHCDESYYLRQIVRMTKLGHGAVQREIAHLLQANLIVRSPIGKEVFYQANQSSPIFTELRSLITKTTGIADVLRAALAPMASEISVAFIYGSVAKGTEKAGSDVDIMAIGAAGFGEIIAALRPVQDQLGREINPSVFTPNEVSRRIAQNDHFISTVLREEKVFLIGDEHDLGRLV